MLAFESCSGNHMERIQRKSPKRECVACSDMASSVQETYTSPSGHNTLEQRNVVALSKLNFDVVPTYNAWWAAPTRLTLSLHIDREPEGVSLAEKLTNFPLYSEHLCI